MNNASSLDDYDEWTSHNGRAKQIFGHHGNKNIDKKKNKNTQLGGGPLQKPIGLLLVVMQRLQNRCYIIIDIKYETLKFWL